ncbi:hypothetical protein [Tautonia plasticadhaerens]|uniref:Uncharacterized protein n=1 Tax=Tautonia plasticadhaerens TaxID=2527974 RepID=A0A518GX79_9BACT|nr:hypothetical protein [Tautonia plasticadhaerens]QDV33198.1 hypothetical protein ElP_10400 [Tautonia plasticadhaerens]
MTASQTSGTQDWRAIAQLSSGGERLLCVGESSSQVRAAYVGAWGEVIRDEDRPTVQTISLQKWIGQVWAGTWEHQQTLDVPATPRKEKAEANGDGDGDGGSLGDANGDGDGNTNGNGHANGTAAEIAEA